jgi:hypothetical protein
VGIAPIFGPDHANRLTNQRLADADQLARLFDLAGAAHPADDDDANVARIVEAIGVGLRQCIRHSSQGSATRTLPVAARRGD